MRASVSNYQIHDCLFKAQIKENIKAPLHWPLCGGGGGGGGLHRSPHKWPVTRKMFPFDVVIMWWVRSDGIRLRAKHNKCSRYQSLKYVWNYVLNLQQHPHGPMSSNPMPATSLFGRWGNIFMHFNFSSCCMRQYIHTIYFFVLQYGFVNHALEMMIVRRFGEEVWDEIR